MTRLTIEQVDNHKNADMMNVFDERGNAQALVHVDAFWEGPETKGELYERLAAGETVTVEIVPVAVGMRRPSDH